MSPARWGIVATVKAPLREIMGFAAFHLEAGAHRIYLYLDAPDDAAAEELNAHPKLRVTQTDDRYWSKKGKRPAKHQPRQTINAADAYAKRVEVDWQAHIDVDEFLICAEDMRIADMLAALPQHVLCARVRPIEALSWDGPAAQPRPFKGFALPQPKRQEITKTLYPRFGGHVNGGFLSHVAGKMLYRTGLPEFHVKLHNAFQGETMNPGQIELDALKLCHMHGADWDDWIARFHYRHTRGAYRAELSAAPGGRTMHDLLGYVMERDGQAGLRAFWDELCTPRGDLMDGLEAHGLLHWQVLDLDPLIAKHFGAAI